MKDKYKSFRLQFIECTKKKIAKDIKCYHCGGTVILCTKYIDICKSGLCRKERTTHLKEEKSG